MILNPTSQRIIESFGGIVWEADPDTFQFSFVSPRAETVLGYSAEEWRAPGFWRQHTHPDDVEWAAAFCLEATARGRDHQFDYRMIAADGRVVWIRDVVTLSRDDEQPLRLRGIMIDITEGKGVEAKLRDTDRRYRAIFDTAPIGIAVVNLDGKLTETNGALQRMLGYDACALEGMSIADITHPDDLQADLALTSEVMSGLRESFELTKRYIRKDRSIMWARLRASVVHDDAGRPHFGFGMVVDITERVLAEAELRRREARYRSFILATAQVVWVADADGQVIADSPEWRALTGQTTDEMMGFGWLDAVEEEDRNRLGATIAARIAERRPFSVEYRLRLAGGTTRHFSGHAVPVFDPTGQLVEWIGTSSDVSSAKEQEQQTLQAQRMEALGRLAGGVAHDFNNILTVISGYSSLLASMCEEGDSRREFALEVSRATVSASMLTRQLLAFSRKQAIHPRVLDPNDVVREMSEMLRRLIGEDVTLELDLDRTCGAILADHGQLEQVLLNLSVNARDAMPRGGIVRIATAETTVREAAGTPLSPGRFVKLTVSDTGDGIRPEIQSRIFEPFFTTKDPGRGTGLGLSTVYGIVSQARGHITVSSECGRGTTFEILFPRVGLPEPVTEGAGPDVQRAIAATILLIEDDDAVRSIATKLLADTGHTVLAARSGADALQISDQHAGDIDLVVTDVVMPHMSGPMVVERLEAVRTGFAILYMSGYPGESLASLGIDEQRVSFVQKPFSPSELLRAVGEALEERD